MNHLQYRAILDSVSFQKSYGESKLYPMFPRYNLLKEMIKDRDEDGSGTVDFEVWNRLSDTKKSKSWIGRNLLFWWRGKQLMLRGMMILKKPFVFSIETNRGQWQLPSWNTWWTISEKPFVFSTPKMMGKTTSSGLKIKRWFFSRVIWVDERYDQPG